MNAWMIVGVIALVSILAGVIITAVSNEGTSQESETISCSTCGNSCTAESNCGLSTCGAVSGQGTGTCGCRG